MALEHARPGVIPWGRRGPVTASIAAGLLFAAAIALTLDAATSHGRWWFASVGALLTFVVVLPFLSPRVEVFSTWGVTALVVALGAGARGLAIGLNYPNAETVDELYTLGRTADDLWPAGIVALGSVAALSAGYWWVHRNSEPSTGLPPRSPASPIPGWVVTAAVTAYAVLGFVSSFLYIRAVGGFGATIGARRTTIPGLELLGSYQSYGHYEALARAAQVACVLALVHWLETRAKVGPLRAGIMAMLLMNALLIGLITTTRADVVSLGLSLLVVYRLSGRRVTSRAVVLLSLVGVVLFAGLTGLRSGGAQESGPVTFVVDSVVLNRNLYDLGKTVQIVTAVPERLAYENGATIGNYALAPVPRFIWPSKPVISPGPVIGREIYGTVRSGVPPGLTAELVWNFGRLAVLPLSFLIGSVVGWFDRRYRPGPGASYAALVTYALVVLMLGRDVVGVSIGRAFSASVQMLALLAPLWLVSRVVGRPVGDGGDGGGVVVG